jgi:DNA-directed RNA polymerase specialized sigma24 family protein
MGTSGARTADWRAVEQSSQEARRSLDELYSITYEELRRAATSMRRGSAVSLSPSTLVNEAWLKLARSPGVAWTSALHFKHLAVRAMRQILVEAARRKHTRKRGRDVAFVTLDELARIEPRHARMIEYRYFGGFDVPETAELLRISPSAVDRDWRLARAWLAVAVQRARQ